MRIAGFSLILALVLDLHTTAHGSTDRGRAEDRLVQRFTALVGGGPSAWQMQSMRKTAEAHAYSSVWVRRKGLPGADSEAKPPRPILVVITFWPSIAKAVEAYASIVTPSLVTPRMHRLEVPYKGVDETCGWEGLPPNDSAAIYIRKGAVTVSISARTTAEAQEFGAITIDQLLDGYSEEGK
ncbi:MAG: hypothetical protein DIJKHBIC_04808 [Thermoanaerobaculia bacterium]|nr:hypothetical protein [Thermoanaerobaculia bacterium]